MTNKRRKEAVLKKFSTMTPIFRIEAVIHDGQYYDVEKWSKVARVSEEEILEYISNNKNRLIKKKDSYRVDYNEVIRWYRENDLKLTEDIVPGNFPPKLWGGKTEPEHFEDAPRRNISSLSGKVYNDKLLSKIKKVVYGYGRIYVNEQGNFVIYTTNAGYLKERIQNELDSSDLEGVNLRIRSSFKFRELIELPESYLEKALPFYIDFAKSQLLSAKKTIEIFIPDEDDQVTQISEWVLKAMQKFDETTPVPFSGYLTNVLQRWPYDLPNNELGAELAKFQRERSIALAKLSQIHDKTDFSHHELAEEMGMTLEKFTPLEIEHQKWISIKYAGELTWSDNGSEKMVQDTGTKDSDPVFSSNLSRALLKSVLKSEDYNGFFSIIQQFGRANIDNSRLNISNEFKTELAKELKRVACEKRRY